MSKKIIPFLFVILLSGQFSLFLIEVKAVENNPIVSNNDIDINSNDLFFELSNNSATVRQDYDEIVTYAMFTHLNGSSFNGSADISATLLSGKFSQFFDPPVDIKRKNSTHWNLVFSIEKRVGFTADNYTIQFKASYLKQSITSNFNLNIRANQDNFAPTMMITEANNNGLQKHYSFLNGENYTFDLHVKDNREINYVSLWNFDQEIDISARGSAGEAPFNASGILFTNRTDIIMNLTLTNTFFNELQTPEGDFTCSFYAVDRSGNIGWLDFNFSISIDIWSGAMDLNIPNKIFDANDISISWDYFDEIHPKSPYEFKIEIDTNADKYVDTILEEKYPDTVYNFEMPQNWTIPEDLTIVQEIERVVNYQLKITTFDKYGNMISAFGGIKINITDYIENDPNDHDPSISNPLSGDPIGQNPNNGSSSSSLWKWIIIGSLLFIFGPTLISPIQKLRNVTKGNNRNNRRR